MNIIDIQYVWHDLMSAQEDVILIRSSKKCLPKHNFLSARQSDGQTEVDSGFLICCDHRPDSLLSYFLG